MSSLLLICTGSRVEHGVYSFRIAKVLCRLAFVLTTGTVKVVSFVFTWTSELSADQHVHPYFSDWKGACLSLLVSGCKCCYAMQSLWNPSPHKPEVRVIPTKPRAWPSSLTALQCPFSSRSLTQYRDGGYAWSLEAKVWITVKFHGNRLRPMWGLPNLTATILALQFHL